MADVAAHRTDLDLVCGNASLERLDLPVRHGGKVVPLFAVAGIELDALHADFRSEINRFEHRLPQEFRNHTDLHDEPFLSLFGLAASRATGTQPVRLARTRVSRRQHKIRSLPNCAGSGKNEGATGLHLVLDEARESEY